MRNTNSDFHHGVRERSSAQDRQRHLGYESVGHRVKVFPVPGDKGIRGVAEAKQAAGLVIDNGSVLTACFASATLQIPLLLGMRKTVTR